MAIRAMNRPISNHSDMGKVPDPLRKNRQPFGRPTRTPRVLLGARGARSGSVDGAWWPWTANLTAELHDLISVVTPRLGYTVRVGFDWNSVSLVQRRIDDDDGIQMHGPGSKQAAGIMHLHGAHGAALALLVIPFDTPPELADRQMRLAAGQPRSVKDPAASTASQRSRVW
jgi:hypothetical protein